ncbi:MAG: NAD(P)-dependent oxidoreductase [Pseudomonadota bacterium]
MKILFTGGSSFTGFWFIEELIENGHDVVMTLRASINDYTGVRKQRIEQLHGKCTILENTNFGDERFLETIRREKNFDMLCHHAADVTNYKSSDFDICAALQNNTHNIQHVLQSLAEQGCHKIVLTGSVFEADEGAGSDSLDAFSPYGVSKGLTADVFRYYSHIFNLDMGKFVIANPFGPYEEPRFTSYLARTWLNNEIAEVRTPDYVRDNIHVSLLAKEYHDFVERVYRNSGTMRHNPSGYIGTQGAFTMLVAEQMRERLNRPCEVSLLTQTSFEEPHIRINTDSPNTKNGSWNESASWDSFAAYYLKQYQ